MTAVEEVRAYCKQRIKEEQQMVDPSPESQAYAEGRIDAWQNVVDFIEAWYED